jgi:hypothetical protein
MFCEDGGAAGADSVVIVCRDIGRVEIAVITSSQSANESWEFSFAGASLGTHVDIRDGVSFASNNRFDVMFLARSVLNGLKSAIEHITINEDHRPGQ